MQQNRRTSRRSFIHTGGWLSIGFSLVPVWVKADISRNPDKKTEQPINAWLQVQEDGKVLVLTGKMELGQGILTAIMQVAAEELNCSIDLVHIQMADTDLTPNEGYTAGSQSIESSAMSVRNAAANAREILIEMAATEFQLPETLINLKNGNLTGPGKSISIQNLLKGQQLTQDLRIPKSYLSKSKRTLVGHPVPRKDLAEIVQGKPHFVHDLQLKDMLHARIIRPAGYTSRLESIDENTIRKLPGLAGFIRKNDFLAVVSTDEYQAIKLAGKIQSMISWSKPVQLPAGDSLKSVLKKLSADTTIEKQSIDWNARQEHDEVLSFSASYYKPYIMHGAMGPSCSVALYKKGELTIWTHSQGVFPLRKAIAGLLNLEENKIHVKGLQGAGCYGHNGADDVAAEAATIAYNYPNKPIRLQWMRQEEHAWEPYSTPMLMDLKASLDKNGKITRWHYELWSDVHGTRPGGNANNLLPFHYLYPEKSKPMTGFKGGAIRNAEPYYNFDQQKIVSHIFTGPLRRSSLRGLGAYGNIFAIESFMEELAEKAGQHPISFRIAHSTDPRSIACLKKIQELTNYIKISQGEGIGFGFSRYKNTAAWCAVAALVKTDPTNNINIEKMWAVVDAGETINPDGLKNQIEGGMLQSISWALMEKVGFDTNHINSLHWRTYPILRFRQAPALEVIIIDRVEESPLGAGEAAQGPATAALVNAIYASSGKRIRELPINKK